MELIDFVFNIIKAVSPIEQEQAANLRRDLEKDLEKVITDPKHEDFDKDNFKTKILIFFRNPWVRLGMAATCIVWIKLIKDWYQGKFDENQNEQIEN